MTFRARIEVTNVGFTESKNIVVDISSLSWLKAYRAIAENSDEMFEGVETFKITIPSLDSLESKSFFIYGSVPVNKWNSLRKTKTKDQLLNQDLLLVETDRYPFFEREENHEVERGLYI